MKNEMDDRTELRLQRLSALLSELDPTEAETRASAAAIRARLARPRGLPVGFKIAASIVLLLGLALAVPPARAWMLDNARAIGGKLGFLESDKRNASRSVNESVRQPGGAAVRISFPVTTEIFDFEIVPAAGQLVIRRSNDRLATAEAERAPDARFTVLRGLRIEGPSSPAAIFTITLPRNVTSIRVHDRVYSLAEAELRLDLRQF